MTSAGSARANDRIAAYLDASDLRGAATEALRQYGTSILLYLRSLLGDHEAAYEAFSEFSENLWSALPRFRREASFRTWPMYVGLIVSDWVVAPLDYQATTGRLVYPHQTSGAFYDPTHPNALWGWMTPAVNPISFGLYSVSEMKTMYNANNFFSMGAIANETDHTVTVTIAPSYGKEALGSLRNLIGAHLQACYLECSNGKKLNNCPGTCPCGTNVCAGYSCGSVENCGGYTSCGTCGSNYICPAVSNNPGNCAIRL